MFLKSKTAYPSHLLWKTLSINWEKKQKNTINSSHSQFEIVFYICICPCIEIYTFMSTPSQGILQCCLCQMLLCQGRGNSASQIHLLTPDDTVYWMVFLRVPFWPKSKQNSNKIRKSKNHTIHPASIFITSSFNEYLEATSNPLANTLEDYWSSLTCPWALLCPLIPQHL